MIYYVANSGDDTADGKSALTPWRTINKANGVQASDTIRFKCGDTWREQLDVTKPGVTVSSYVGSLGITTPPIIKGSTVASGWSATASPSVATYVSDAFGRVDSASWGTADSGTDTSLAWTPFSSDAAFFTIVSNKGVITKDSGGARAFIGDAHGGSVEAYGEFANIQHTSDNFGVSLLAYQSGTFSNFYSFGYRRSDGAAILWKRSGSTDTLLASVTKTDQAAVSVRGRVLIAPGSKRRLQLRVWQTGTDEPDTWDIDLIDAAPLSAGTFGVYVYNTTSSGDATVDNLAFKSSPASFSNTYQSAVTLDPGEIVCENGTLLDHMTSVEDVEANAGSYFWDSNVLYVHATAGGDPTPSLYEYPLRPYGISVRASHAVVEHVVLEHGSEAGLKTSSAADYPELRYLVSRQNNQWGVYCSDDSGGGLAPWVHHVEAYENKRFAGIGIRQAGGNGLVELNTVYSNGVDDFRDHGIYAIVNGTGLITVRWNLSYLNAAANYKASLLSTSTLYYENLSWLGGRYGYAADGGSTGSRWLFNTDDGSRWNFAMFTDAGDVIVDQVQGNVFANAIEYAIYKEGPRSGTITVLSHNCVWNAGIAAYQGVTEGEASFTADPMFTNPDARDYTLQPDSPCIAVGLDVPDIERRQTTGRPDLGAAPFLPPVLPLFARSL